MKEYGKERVAKLRGYLKERPDIALADWMILKYPFGVHIKGIMKK